MTTDMAIFLGYDEFGNCEELLCESDRDTLEFDNWHRASGEVICKCGSPYRSHPPVQGMLWLTRTCEGLVKL